MNIVLAVPVDEQLASFIGKKGSANSITFYNRKIDEDVIVALFPGQEDEKVYSLAEAILIASKIVLSTSAVDKRFGEALVASSLVNRKVLLTNENDVSRIIKESGMADYEVVAKERLLEAIKADMQGADKEIPVRVDIDKAFPVKGVGTVALGIVKKGTVKQHDKLYHSSGKQVTIRSIQSQDQDVGSADKGTRVGLAIKDMTDDQIGKGDILTPYPVNKVESIVVQYKASVIAKEMVKENKVYGIASGFSFTECTVKKAEGQRLELDLKTKLPLELGDELLLIRKEAPKIFASGKVLQILS